LRPAEEKNWNPLAVWGEEDFSECPNTTKKSPSELQKAFGAAHRHSDQNLNGS